MAAAVLLGAASCGKEDTTSSVDGEQVEVTFTANLPELGTRAYGDGLTATNLQYFVYEKTDNGLTELSALRGETGFTKRVAKVNLALIKGMTYVITFWADNNDAPYTFDGQTVSINYTNGNATNVNANDEKLDAFFGTKEFNPSVDTDTNVELRRPFAQLNAITTDCQNVKLSGITKILKSSIKVKRGQLNDKFNLLTGEATCTCDPSVAEEWVSFTTANIPAESNVIGDTTTDMHLAMNYLLVNGNKSLIDVEFSFIGEHNGANFPFTAVALSNIPVQRNYRTNILGSLLTKSTDFTVEIKPGFGGEEVANVFSGVMHESINITKNGYYIFDNLNLTVESGAAVNITAGLTDVVISLAGNVYIESANGSGIAVAEGAALTLTGGHITAKGNGDHAFGIGGNGATVTLDGVTVDYACGGHIQPLFVNDTKYGKSEPEGGAAIGGAEVNILNSTITKVDGGSKAAAIGAQYWQGAVINIENSTIREANGGNASAGIGGSRYGSDSKYNLEINIINSTVTATGGQAGAGVGSGYDTHCNGQDYSATNVINIDATSTVNATGGKYAAGIGTGFHSAYLSGAIEAGATINAVSGENFYKDAYTTAQNIGYGVVDPAREFSGNNANVTFKVAGQVIENPDPKMQNGYYEDDNGNYHILNANGWLWMAEQNDTFFGSKTIYLDNDIDFAGIEIQVTKMWTPEYSATFDGQNHTISNIWMASNYTSNNQALFDGLMTVKNLNVDRASVFGMSQVGIIGANIFGNIENCHVTNSRSYGYVHHVGGIVGLHSWGEIKNCSVENTSIECYYYGAVGAIAGAMNEVSRNITGCSVKGCSLIKEGPEGVYPDWDPCFGIAVGYAYAPGTYVFNVEIENNTIKGVASEQMYGEVATGSTVTINGVQQ